MKRKVLLIGAVTGSLCIVCAVAALIYSLTPGGKANATAQAETLTAQPTNTMIPTATFSPTATFEPTATPQPTETVRPTQTSVIDTPAPIATAEVKIAPTTGYPPGIIAICNDGTLWAGEHRQGSCRGHDGVKSWIGNPPP
jgi:hypothetical protein